jgi:DNA-directed RNA polymerase specialized sigma subunit
VITIFGWLKRKPNLELVSIDDKLNQLNQSVTANAEIQAATLGKLNEKAEKTLESVSGIAQHLTVSDQTMPEEMRKIILESLEVWIKLEETKKELQHAIETRPDASGKTSGIVPGISPASGRVHPDTRPEHPDDLKNIRVEIERLTVRQRQLIGILMERGWLTYEEIAQHLGISVSRARNYVSEIIGRGFPVSKVDSIEGKKIGIATTIQDFILEDKHPDTRPHPSGMDG